MTVSTGPLPLGTVIWSNPGDGSGVQSIVPAVPSTSGVADVFAFQADGTVQAITSDGITAWTANVNQAMVVPDFQGGLVVGLLDPITGAASIMKLDGVTGQPYPAYTLGQDWMFNFGTSRDPLAVHPDGTIFAVQQYWGARPSSAPPYTVVGIDPTTGAQKFSVPLLPTGVSGWVAGDMIVAGDGYAYVPYRYRYFDVDAHAGAYGPDHWWLLRVSSSGASDNIHIADVDPCVECMPQGNLITNADQGALLTFWDGDGVNYMAVVTGTSASLVSPPQVAGQAWAQPVIPVLQAQDGSFVGWYYAGDQNQCCQTNMVAFDASGTVRWTVPNETPQIATADGGVIGQSGTTYDQNGNATGQMNPTTQSWLANAYQLGPVNQVVAAPLYVATNWWPFAGANVSGNGTAAQQPWFEPLQTCSGGSTPCAQGAGLPNDGAAVRPHDSPPAPLPSCPGGSTPCAQEAIMSALSALRTLVQGPCTGCNNWVFNHLPGYSQPEFSNYLSRKPRLWDGTRSYVAIDIALCPSGFFSKNFTCAFAGKTTTVHDYLGESEAVSQTPSDSGKGMQVFFNPATGICNRLSVANPQPGDQGVLNQAVLFHEALHGYTGKEDNTLESSFPGVPVTLGESVSITYYLEGKVIPGGAYGAASCTN